MLFRQALVTSLLKIHRAEKVTLVISEADETNLKRKMKNALSLLTGISPIGPKICYIFTGRPLNRIVILNGINPLSPTGSQCSIAEIDLIGVRPVTIRLQYTTQA